jgi:hypothetical protein
MGKRHSPIDVGIATATTLAHRLPDFWQDVMSPSPRGNAAIAGLIVEKQVAFAQGMMSLQAEMLKLAFRPWWTWDMWQGQRAAGDLLHAAAAPAARKVKANARRLRKR